MSLSNTGSSSNPQDLADSLSRLLAGLDTPLRLDAALRRLGRPATEHDLIRAARLLARRREGLFHNRLLFPPAMLEFAEASLVHEPGGRFTAHLDDGRTLALPVRETRRVLDGDRVTLAVVAPKGDRPADAVPVRLRQRTVTDVWGRIVATPDGLRLSAERRVEPLILVPAGNVPPVGTVVRASVEETGFLSPGSTARVVECLGHVDAPGIESELARRLWALPGPMPATAAALCTGMRPPTRRGRVDLRDLALATIDGASSRDFDDAVHAVETAVGWDVTVAIADVSHYVRPGDALDRLARERLTSIYLPHTTLPMLPEALSNGLCSLNPGEPRAALACRMSVSTDGRVTATRFERVLMRSQARLTYDQVTAALDGTRDRRIPEAVMASLVALDRCAAALNRAAGTRRLDMGDGDLRLALGDDGKVLRIHRDGRTRAHRLVEECMLAANLSAAAFLDGRGVGGLFRNHRRPEEEASGVLLATLATFGLVPDADRPLGAALAGLVERARTMSDWPTIRSAILKALSPATYEPANAGHFSLGEAAYTHFTSPIRRYPDLVVHRLIVAALEGREAPHTAEELLALAEACTRRNRAAGGAENEARKLLMTSYANRLRDDTSRTAVAGSTAENGLFVQLRDELLEAFVPARMLKEAGWRFDASGAPAWRALGGRRVGPGDEFPVRIAGAEATSRRITLQPVAA